METSLKAPFPWFGGKSRAAPLIWAALGPVPNFVEPFAGALGCLLSRPDPPGIETVNDLDAYVTNVWRALQTEPDAVARWCDFPPHEAQLHAVHAWLVGHRDTVTARILGDPAYYDVQVAGYWLYGIACWIGGGWCSGDGPWQSVNGEFVDTRIVDGGTAGQGMSRRLLHLKDAGRGVHKRSQESTGLLPWFHALQDRLRHVRACCGDWTRVLGPSVTIYHGLTGILLDPPYGEEEDREMALYRVDSGTVARDVRAWCLAHGNHPLLRIVLCGYGTTHDVLLEEGWWRQEWTASGGYGNLGNGRGRVNKAREVLWCSPHCLRDTSAQLSFF